MSDFAHEKLLPVIRCGLGLEVPTLDLNEQDYNELLRFGAKHSIQVIIIQGLRRFDILPKYHNAIEDEHDRHVGLFMFHIQAMEDITEALNNASVPFIPLKGSVIRDLYPDPSMRSSCDIDILVHEKDLDKAVEAIKANTDLEYKDRKYHDVLLANDIISLELHFSVKENMSNIDRLLKEAWNHAVPPSDGYCYKFTPEYLMFHVLSHMSYHMVHGGLGIRHFIDLWVLRNKLSFDENEFKKMCSECGILTFYEKCCVLADYWFSDGVLPDELKTLEKYCLEGGVFGSSETAAAANQREHKGIKYVFRRVFITTEVLQDEFPELRDKPYLWLYFQFKRWLRVFDKERRQGELARIKQASKISKDEIKGFDEFLKSLGL